MPSAFRSMCVVSSLHNLPVSAAVVLEAPALLVPPALLALSNGSDASSCSEDMEWVVYCVASVL